MDSTVVDPFKKWEMYDPRNKQAEVTTNYAAGKTKLVAWYVAECETPNNRMAFVSELQKYIQVGFDFLICNLIQ